MWRFEKPRWLRESLSVKTAPSEMDVVHLARRRSFIYTETLAPNSAFADE